MDEAELLADRIGIMDRIIYIYIFAIIIMYRWKNYLLWFFTIFEREI